MFPNRIHKLFEMSHCDILLTDKSIFFASYTTENAPPMYSFLFILSSSMVYTSPEVPFLTLFPN